MQCRISGTTLNRLSHDLKGEEHAAIYHLAAEVPSGFPILAIRHLKIKTSNPHVAILTYYQLLHLGLELSHSQVSREFNKLH